MTNDLDKYRTPEGNVRKVTVPPNEGVAARPAERVLSHGMARYFQAILSRLDHLEYGDPSEFVLRRTGVDTDRRPLEEVWVPPIFRQHDEAGAELTLETLLADEAPCVLVLAYPGHGKSTLARFLTCDLFRGFRQGRFGCFGLYVPLCDLKINAGSDQRAIIECALNFVGLGTETSLVDDIEKELDRAILIFDGLDELPIRNANLMQNGQVTLRRNAAETIRLLNVTRSKRPDGAPAIRSIVTSRASDYFEDKSSTLGAVPQYVLSNFSPHQVRTAIQKWHRAAKRAVEGMSGVPAGFAAEMDGRIHAVENALRDNPDLASVCLTPLMLSILQSVYSDKGDIPSSVSQLCDRAVNWLLIEKPVKFEPQLSKEHQAWLKTAIGAAGWEVHRRSVSGIGKFLNNDDLRKIVKDTSPIKATNAGEYDVREDVITRITSHLRRGHGILVNVSDGQYDFAHNVFREVMAGYALGLRPVTELRQFALDEAWHGPIRYWAGLKAFDKSNSRQASEAGLNEINAFVGELATDCDEHNMVAILACGEMLAEACMVGERSKFIRDLKTKISDIRTKLAQALSSPQLRFSQRIKIGDLLGILGDPRLDKGPLERIWSFDGGSVTIGRAQNHKARNPKYESCPASPVIVGELHPYSVGTFLVTNVEFGKFIAAGGYKDQKFWASEVGWNWANADAETNGLLVEHARAEGLKHLSSEIVGRRIVREDIPDRCEKMIHRRFPLYWDDPSLNRPNQPVVGVNWWEAQAYCRWLEHELSLQGALKGKKRIRLPTEVEWESAARKCGDSNIYPWKEGEPEQNAHVRSVDRDTKEGSILRSCAVGSFPFVPTNLPIFDFVGNVWEWTSSIAEPYTNNSFSDVVNFEGLQDRIARGSSWLSPEIEASQITFRSFDPPCNAYEDLGFRIAIVGPEPK
jgi:formylglycine-generating enzyme required for sulfatase activity